MPSQVPAAEHQDLSVAPSTHMAARESRLLEATLCPPRAHLPWQVQAHIRMINKLNVIVKVNAFTQNNE